MARVLRIWVSGRGGWAFVAEEAGEVMAERSGAPNGCPPELQSVIEGLTFARDLGRVRTVQLCSDSQRVVDGINTLLPLWVRNGWKATTRRGSASLKNVDTWQEIAALSESLPRLRPVKRVPVGDQITKADRLARAAAEQEDG